MDEYDRDSLHTLNNLLTRHSRPKICTKIIYFFRCLHLGFSYEFLYIFHTLEYAAESTSIDDWQLKTQLDDVHSMAEFASLLGSILGLKEDSG